MSNRPRTTFTDTLNEMRATAAGGVNRKRTSPSARKAKVEIRERVLEEIGAERAHVLDLFAGAGEMHEAVWKKAASYTGIDLAWWQDDRLMFVGDNCRVMRAIDLQPYNLIDGDSYGSPWTTMILLAARRSIAKGERVGLTLTCGEGLRLRMNAVPDALAILAGVRRKMQGAARNHEGLIDRALQGLCQRMNCRIVKRWQAQSRAASGLFYLGCVLEGV